MRPLRLAVVGVGHLGKEHARILGAMSDVELVGVVDANPDQVEAVAARVGCRPFRDHRPLLDAVDAAVIAVPTTYHHAVACDFLRQGVSLLVEKPMALTVEQADEMLELARGYGAMLQVGHIERFNPAFEELCRRPLRPKFIQGERLGTFTGRSTDIGVVLDLLIHDIDLVLSYVGEPVVDVEAVGISVLGAGEDMVNARLRFADGCVAEISASRLSLQPSRRMNLWGAEGFAGIDFAKKKLTLVQPSESLRSGVDVRGMAPAQIAAFKDELFTRHLNVEELDRNSGDQLTRELENFVDCVRTGDRPRVTGEDGREALAVADRVLRSVDSHAWEATEAGPTGPRQTPPARGPLLRPFDGQAAA